MPRIALNRMRDGARWWKGPDFEGLTKWRLCIKSAYASLARKKEPEVWMASQRTTVTFWPLSACLATIEARRPSR